MNKDLIREIAGPLGLTFIGFAISTSSWLLVFLGLFGVCLYSYYNSSLINMYVLREGERIIEIIQKEINDCQRLADHYSETNKDASDYYKTMISRFELLIKEFRK